MKKNDHEKMPEGAYVNLLFTHTLRTGEDVTMVRKATRVYRPSEQYVMGAVGMGEVEHISH